MSKRRATRRDLPMLFLVESVFTCLIAILLSPFFPNEPLVSNADLQPLSGTVRQVFHRHGRAGNYFNLSVQAVDGNHHLTQEDLLSETIPAMDRFVPGDQVAARVKRDPRKNLDWCWELVRNGQTILTYGQTYDYLQRMRARDWKISQIALALSGILLSCAFLLRFYFGGWVDRHEKLLQEPAARQAF
jgi:hypothetical protein